MFGICINSESMQSQLGKGDLCTWTGYQFRKGLAKKEFVWAKNLKLLRANIILDWCLTCLLRILFFHLTVRSVASSMVQEFLPPWLLLKLMPVNYRCKVWGISDLHGLNAPPWNSSISPHYHQLFPSYKGGWLEFLSFHVLVFLHVVTFGSLFNLIFLLCHPPHFMFMLQIA